ncbi:MAG: hypothetical protein HY703_06520 [Gemmatimonadetes bacterium]|nr:hypothetical protein [Gemmatimonadota bacterium]
MSSLVPCARSPSHASSARSEKDLVPFTITANTLATILLELNSEAWVTKQNVRDRVVDDAEVQQAATASRRTGPRS